MMLGIKPHPNFSWVEPPRILNRLLTDGTTVNESPLLTGKSFAYALFIDFLHLTELDGRDRRSVIHSRNGMRDVLEAAAEKSNLMLPATRQLLEFLDDFFADVQRIDAGEQTFHVKTVHKKDNAIAYFLHNYRRKIEEVGDAEDFPRWSVLCLAIYRALRVAVDTPAETEDNWHQRVGMSSLAVLHIGKYLPLDFLRDEDLPESFGRGAVADAARVWFRKEKPDLDYLELQRRRATRFFAGKRYSWEKYRKRKSRIRDKPKIKTSFSGDVVHNFSGNEGPGGKEEPEEERFSTGTLEDVWADQARQQIREGAAPAEFEAAAEQLPRKRQAVEGSAANSFALQPPNQMPSWAKSRLTAEILGVTLSWLESRARVSPENRFRRSILTFVKLQIFYGFSASTLLDARFSAKWTARQNTVGKKDEKGKSSPEPIVLYKNGVFTVRPSRQDGNSILAARQTDKTVYEDSGFDFDLLVPPSAKESFDFSHRLPHEATSDAPNLKTFAAESLGNLFITNQNGKGWQPLTEKLVNEELKMLNSELSEVIPAASKITAARIGTSASTLLREHGLNELIAAFVCGEIPRHLASQPFYTSMKQAPMSNTDSPQPRRLARFFSFLFDGFEFVIRFFNYLTSSLDQCFTVNHLYGHLLP